MSKVTVNSYEEFGKYIGKQIGVSDYLKITQDRIDMFADATLDHQWIHVNKERAKTESPFNDTIAHGYLMLSLLPYMWNQIIEVNNIKMLINYGIDKLRFSHPVVVDNEVRLVVKLESLKNLRGITKAEIKFALEIKGEKRNAMEGTVIFLYHFTD